MRGEISKWLRGDLVDVDGQSQINDAINNAIEKIWMSAIQVQLSRFIGTSSPVTFQLPSGTEEVNLISIADPTTPLAPANTVLGALGIRTYNLGYTYVTESGSETLQSPISIWNVPANNLVNVTAPAPVAGALGWNLYAGILNQALQNQQPLPFGVISQEPATGFQDYPTFQQTPPTKNCTADNISYIQHLEMITTDGLKIAWNQADLDSQLMRRMARVFPSASQYTSFAWDLINGNRLEFRPVPGTDFSPRYWYIAKPRRLRYDQAEIPYASLAGFHEYIWSYSLSLCKLSLEEYQASEEWEKKANAAKLDAMLALSQENVSRNNRIIPYLF